MENKKIKEDEFQLEVTELIDGIDIYKNGVPNKYYHYVSPNELINLLKNGN